MVSVMKVDCISLVTYTSTRSSSIRWNYHKLAAEQLLLKEQAVGSGRAGQFVTVQITPAEPLPSNKARQGAVLGQFSLAFGLCGPNLYPVFPP